MKETESRKQDHLTICLNENVEHGKTRLDEIRLVHTSLPELSLNDIDINTVFLKQRVQAPVFISCMTGGSKNGASINTRLAEVAATCNIPMGLGSIRILFEQNDSIADFSVRHIAPNIPLFANLGVNELRYIGADKIFSMLETLGVSAIALHLNPAQELYQKNGERDFSNFIEYIQTFIGHCPIPVIIKETGYGLHSAEVDVLLGYGAYYVDVAGGGGSNWAKIEQIRNAGKYPLCADVFDLATPTGMLLLSLMGKENILASGGIRTALDVVKCMMLGSTSVGMALPILHNVQKSSEHLMAYFEALFQQIKTIMLLCGAKNISDTRAIPFWIEKKLRDDFLAYAQATHLDVPQGLVSKLNL